MSSKYHIAKRKFVYDVFRALLGTIFLTGFAATFLFTEVEEEVYEIGLTEFYILIAVIVVGLLGQLTVYWLIMRKHVFSDQEKSFFVEKGLFFKRKANIPYKNIHTISVKRRFLDLILGLSIIEIDTGTTASFQAEGRLVLDKKYAIVLKNFLESKKTDNSLVLPSPKDFEEITPAKNNTDCLHWYQLLFLSIMKPWFLSSVLLIITTIIGVGSLTIYMAEELSYSQNFIDLIYVSLGAIGFSMISTMIYHFFKYYKYSYYIDEAYITYSYGLLKKVEFKTPIKRINAVHINQSLLFRIFGFYQLNVAILGVGEFNDAEQLKTESKSILPFAKTKEVSEVLGKIGFMTNDYDQVILPQKFKYLNFIILPMLFLVVLNLIPHFVLEISLIDFVVPVIIQVLFIIIAFIGAFLALKQHLIKFNSNEFLFQRGAFTLKQTIVKKQRIQFLSYKQNPILLIERIGNVFVAYKDILGFIMMRSINRDSFNLIKRNFLD